MSEFERKDRSQNSERPYSNRPRPNNNHRGGGHGHGHGHRGNQRPNFGSNERKKQGIRGHDAALYGMVKGEETVTVFLNSPLKIGATKSDSIVGKLTQYDAYTITLEVDGLPSPLILFKSTVGGLMKNAQ